MWNLLVSLVLKTRNKLGYCFPIHLANGGSFAYLDNGNHDKQVWPVNPFPGVIDAAEFLGGGEWIGGLAAGTASIGAPPSPLFISLEPLVDFFPGPSKHGV